jgi:hypothetical protein
MIFLNSLRLFPDDSLHSATITLAVVVSDAAFVLFPLDALCADTQGLSEAR